MIAIEKCAETKVRSTYNDGLRVERTDICFEDVDECTVRIQVTIHNAGEQRSRPTTMRIQAAPFGAFVPWRPLAVLPVPPLEPGESRELSTEVLRDRPTPLGDFDRVPPRRIVMAANAPDQPPAPSGNGILAMLELLRRSQAARAPGGGATTRTASLPPDLMELVGRQPTYWAGNINIFIGAHRVERHMARALRIYPGRTNLAMFMVGNPAKRDAYAFELLGLAPDWKAALYDSSKNRSLLIDPSQPPIQESEWLESEGGMVVLATQPPVDCREGSLEVHVTRRSDAKIAVVEFNLDPSAQGAGCYFV